MYGGSHHYDVLPKIMIKKVCEIMAEKMARIKKVSC